MVTHTDVDSLMDSFAKQYEVMCEEPIVFCDSFADKIVSNYHNVVNADLGGWLGNGSNPDRHKRASLIELCIMEAMPIEHSDEQTKAGLNAEVAMMFARSVVLQYYHRSELFESEHKLAYIPVFDSAHLKWLFFCETERFPIMSNAMTWFLYDLLIVERYTREYGSPLIGDPNLQ